MIFFFKFCGIKLVFIMKTTNAISYLDNQEKKSSKTLNKEALWAGTLIVLAIFVIYKIGVSIASKEKALKGVV